MTNKILPLNEKLLLVDQFLLPDHFYLDSQDIWLFYGEYTAKKSYQGEINSLIYNFKKAPNFYKGTPKWHFKLEAIQKVADIFTKLKTWTKMQNCIWIPMPPSKSENDPAYDNRLTETLKKMQMISPTLKFYSLVKIKYSRNSAHDNKDRPSPDQHYSNFQIDNSISVPEPNCIIIFDDVLTTGSSFKGMKRILSEKFPNKPIYGVFIARTRREAEPIDL